MADVTEWVQGAGNSILSGLFGYVAALATFKLKFALVDARIDALRTEQNTARAHDKELLALALGELSKTIAEDRKKVEAWAKRSERRASVTLELIAAVAHKSGVKHRALGVDALARIMTSEDDGGSNDA